MIKVICITARFPQTEKIGDILYLDQNSIFNDSDGDWYEKFYKLDEDMNFIEQGIRLLNRFKILRYFDC